MAAAPLPELVTSNLDAVRELCRKHHVKRLSIFGSAVKGTFDPARSDLDFVVEFEWDEDPLVRGRRSIALSRALEELFGRDVDLVNPVTVRNPYFREVLRLTQQSLYDAA